MSKTPFGKGDPPALQSTFVNIRAAVESVNDTTVTLRIDTREPTAEENRVLDVLFPNTGRALGKLLRAEALLAAFESGEAPR